MHSSINYIKNAFRAGASGYIVKESTSEQLIRGLNSMTKDDYFLDNSVSHQVIDELIEHPDKKTKIVDSLYETLSQREQEVFRLLAEGLTSKEIAIKLFISPKTADNHRSNINYKLGLQGTVELIRYAVKLGLIDVDSWKN